MDTKTMMTNTKKQKTKQNNNNKRKQQPNKQRHKQKKPQPFRLDCIYKTMRSHESLSQKASVKKGQRGAHFKLDLKISFCFLIDFDVRGS